jgi:membrane protein required for colicin V production
MNLLDLGIAVILVLLAVRGYWRGLLQEVSVILGLVAGLIFAAHYYLQGARLVGQYVHTPLYSRILSFFIIFLLVYWAVRLAGRFLQRLFAAVALGSLDRLLGLGFAVLKGCVILGFFLTVISLAVSKDSKLLQESVATPYLKTMYQQTLILLPKEFKDQVRERALKFEREWGGKKRGGQAREET